MKENNAPKAILLSEYQAPAFWVESVSLHFLLNEDVTTVTNTMSLRRNAARNSNEPLYLDGSHSTLVSVSLNGRDLHSDEYRHDDESLTIPHLPEHCELTVITEIQPQLNTALEGLYKSSGNYCTQCEAQGFRRITYYPDRPDVMARFTVTIDAEKKKYPVLLSNGNPVERGDLEDGRHFVTWEDPHPKPSYLFALVAGDLACVKDRFITASGREVSLEIYVEDHNKHKCDHAMVSLKKSMQWDEDVFGLEYDLDIYMIVAVDDFNMGAMENKGLNVFNSKFVLADQQSATDADFQNIEGVIAHEYFHNWTGNRVTCRDWFQLSLKEGLTVFRDQEFSSDMNSRAVKRIEDVRLLRTRQFPEDAGPTAHPIRPDSYIEINNFYTLTVYEKGAEVIRMIHTLLGAANFRKGMDLYFKRHDGQAVTCDDFVSAMADASRIDLSTFQRWYSQAGTPELKVDMNYDAGQKTCELTFMQTFPGHEDNLPTHIPVKMSLLNNDGDRLALNNSSADGQTECVLDIKEVKQSFVFKDVESAPTPSLLRGFSAPVKLRYDYDDETLAFLMAHDDDPFNRWEAGQKLALRVALGLVNDVQAGNSLSVPEHFLSACLTLINNRTDNALLTEALHFPSEETIGEELEAIDIKSVFDAREFMLKRIAEHVKPDLLEVYQRCQDNNEFRIDAEAIGKRNLKNTCLQLLSRCEEDIGIELAKTQFENASNMSDEIAALRVLCNRDDYDPTHNLQQFYTKWKADRLVIDKWFSLQAMSARSDTLAKVEALRQHSDFELQNPNRVRSLIGAFSIGNPVRFHAENGAGYKLLSDIIIELDSINPQVAARMVGAMARWRRFTERNRDAMKAELQRILAVDSLSNDVYELVEKSLQ